MNTINELDAVALTFGTAVLLPLMLAALLASPLLSFFR